jgi:cobalt-precorrin 5A hydrolase
MAGTQAVKTEGDVVAGFGFRQTATAEDFAAALAAALEAADLPAGALSAIAVPAAKQGAAAEAFTALRGLPLLAVSKEAMQAAAAGCVTQSARSETALGVPSVAEAVALAGAGPGAELVQARVETAVVTCALAKKR